jgi:hypothetical protein
LVLRSRWVFAGAYAYRDKKVVSVFLACVFIAPPCVTNCGYTRVPQCFSNMSQEAVSRQGLR